MFFLTLPQEFINLLRFTAFPFTTPALMEILDASSPNIPFLVSIHPVDHSALHILGPLSLNQILILFFLLLDLLINLMVGIMETIPYILDHLSVFFPIFHVHGIPQFELLNLFILMIFLHL